MDRVKAAISSGGSALIRGWQWLANIVITKATQLQVAVKEDLKGWLVCTAVLIITVVRSGVTYSFGVFVVPLMEEFKGNMAEQSWIGTLSFCISLCCSPVSVSFIRSLGHKGYRVGGMIGTVILGISCLGSSFVPNLEWLFFTHSLLYGIGSSLIYMASSLIIAEYFPERHKYHVLATSLLLCGYPVGSLLFNPINAWLIVKFKWRMAFRCASGITLFTGLICCWFFSAKDTSDMERLESPTSSPECEKAITDLPETEKKNKKCCTLQEMKEKPEIPLWYFGNCLSYLGFYMPFVNLAYYMKLKKIPPTESSIALTALSFAECVAYIVASFMGDYLKDRLVYANICSSGALAVICFVWPIIDVAGFEVIVAIAVAMGTFLGLNIVYTYAASGEVTQLPMDVAWSLTNLWSGMGILAGPLFSGAVFEINKNYSDVFNVVGAVYLLDTLVFAAIPLVQQRRQRSLGSVSLQDINGDTRHGPTYRLRGPSLTSIGDQTKDLNAIYGSLGNTTKVINEKFENPGRGSLTNGLNGSCGARAPMGHTALSVDSSHQSDGEE